MQYFYNLTMSKNTYVLLKYFIVLFAMKDKIDNLSLGTLRYYDKYSLLDILYTPKLS